MLSGGPAGLARVSEYTAENEGATHDIQKIAADSSDQRQATGTMWGRPRPERKTLPTRLSPAGRGIAAGSADPVNG